MKLFSIRQSTKCPKCGRRMIRIHRKGWHRLVSKIVPVTRWTCCSQKWLVLGKKVRCKREYQIKKDEGVTHSVTHSS